MEKYIEVTAKTEDEAIAKGLAQLGLDRDDVSVEILERCKTGFLGIGSPRGKPRGGPAGFLSSAEVNSACGNSSPWRARNDGLTAAPAVRGYEDNPGGPSQPPHLYPYPQTVFT